MIGFPMGNYIVPEGQSDADRIADFVQGYLGKKEQNRRMERKVLDVAALVLAYNVAGKVRRANRRRGRR